MYKTRFIDETFDLDNCLNYILSIRFSPDGFSFCILDKTTQKVIVLSSYEFIAVTAFQLQNTLKEIIQTEEILHQNFKRIFINSFDHRVILTPKAVVGVTEAKTVFNLSYNREPFEKIISYQFNQQADFVFAVSSTLKQFLDETFKNPTWLPAPVAALQHANWKNSGEQLILFYDSQTVFIMAINNNDISFFNSYYAKTNSDILFYMLYVVKQLKLDTKIKLTLYGSIEPSSELITNLKKYFTKISFARYRSELYNVSYTMVNEPEFHLVPLIEQCLCE